MTRRWLTLFALSVILAAANTPFGDSTFPMGAALAQDTDDDDDDDDDRGGDDDDDDRGGDDDDDRAPSVTTSQSGGPTGASSRPAPKSLPKVAAQLGASPAPVQAPAQAPVRAPVRVPLPDEAPDEIIVLDLSEPDLAQLLARGFRQVDARPVPGTSILLLRLKIPPTVSLTEARDAIRALPSGANADFNHFYRSEQAETAVAIAASPALPCTGAHCPALAQVGWTPLLSRDPACGGPVTIGMIDTGLNAGHETFRGANFEVLTLADTGLDPSRAIHGTAVAALLAGAPDGRSPGLVPHLRLVAVDVFYRAGSDERADAVSLIEALDLLARQGVQVINLSLAGPPNTVLETMVARLVAQEGIVLVAAAGNAGPAAGPAYPAAYDGVVAVTAIDSADRVYRRAGRGPHIDLAAPGVDIWTAASVKGARTKTGTSFAAPFVTAAAALVLQANPELSPDEVARQLFRSASDLGAPGVDPIFGHGMLQMSSLCAIKG